MCSGKPWLTYFVDKLNNYTYSVSSCHNNPVNIGFDPRQIVKEIIPLVIIQEYPPKQHIKSLMLGKMGKSVKIPHF